MGLLNRRHDSVRYRTSRRERNILRRIAVRIGLLWLCGIVAACLFFLLNGKELPVTIPWEDLGVQSRPADLSGLEIGIADESVRLVRTEITDSGLTVTLAPVSAGMPLLEVKNRAGTAYTATLLKVTSFGLLVECSTQCFAHWRVYAALLIVLLGGTTILLLRGFMLAKKECMYSTLCIFFSGFAVWMAVITLTQIFLMVTNNTVTGVVSMIASSGFWFMVCGLPFWLAFAAALSVSNIALIRHEGLKLANLLGLALSAVLVIGSGLMIWVYIGDFEGS